MPNITTAREASSLHGVKVLVHGRAGAGKTVLASTAPQPIILSAESGLLSLRHSDTPVIVIHSMTELHDAYRFFIQSEESKNYWSVCIDSLSEIAESVLTTEKAASRDPRKAYGEMQDQLTGLIRGFRDLPEKHVYFSAKQTANKDEMTGVTLYGPSMPGRQLGPQLPYFFDEVFCLEVGKNAEGQEFRYIRTKTSLQYEAKDRSGVLDEFEQPNLDLIFNKIIGGTQ